jgi:hypothetical protein
MNLESSLPYPGSRGSRHTRPTSDHGRLAQTIGFDAGVSGFTAYQATPPHPGFLSGSLTRPAADHQTLATCTVHETAPLAR